MGRAFALSMGAAILLLIDALAVSLAFSAGAILVAAVLIVLAVLVVWVLLRIRLKSRRRLSSGGHLLHRGATKEHYDPWVGGGLGD